MQIVSELKYRSTAGRDVNSSFVLNQTFREPEVLTEFRALFLSVNAGCVRTASGSDRIMKSPRITNETSRKWNISETGPRGILRRFLIRSLPFAVVTPPLNAWASEKSLSNWRTAWQVDCCSRRERRGL